MGHRRTGNCRTGRDWRRLAEKGRKLGQADRDAARARTAGLTPEEQQRQRMRQAGAPRQSRGPSMAR